MRIPFKMSLLKVRHARPRFIILHHTVCMYPAPSARIDNPKFQLPAIMNNVLEQKTPDINYHYVIEKVKDDYQVFGCRPFVTICDFDDIDVNTNKFAIHVALLGSYDFKIPERRLYETLAYRLLNPLLKVFGLNPARVKFHSEVSNDKELTCPGDFVDGAVIQSMIRRFVVK